MKPVKFYDPPNCPRSSDIDLMSHSWDVMKLIPGHAPDTVNGLKLKKARWSPPAGTLHNTLEKYKPKEYKRTCLFILQPEAGLHLPLLSLLSGFCSAQLSWIIFFSALCSFCAKQHRSTKCGWVNPEGFCDLCGRWSGKIPICQTQRHDSNTNNQHVR